MILHGGSSCNACPKILDMSAELASNKHSSSLVKSVSDEEKSFITSTPEELNADVRWPEFSRAGSSTLQVKIKICEFFLFRSFEPQKTVFVSLCCVRMLR